MMVQGENQMLLNSNNNHYSHHHHGIKNNDNVNSNLVGKRNSSTSFVGDLCPPSLVYIKGEIDESSLGQSMNKHKEQLEVKLLSRRPINQLVAQGIIPIDSSNVDPSLMQKQMLMKKCQLGSDPMNDHVPQRPTSMELINKNALHGRDKHNQSISGDDSQIEYKPLKNGQIEFIKAESVNEYLPLEEDYQTSLNVIQSPQEIKFLCMNSDQPLTTTIHHAMPAQTIPAGYGINSSGVVDITNSLDPGNPGIMNTTSTLSMPASIEQNLQNIDDPAFRISSPSQISKPLQLPMGKDRYRRKSKTKLPKPRTIKFHEYKYPPCMMSSTNPPTEVFSSSMIVHSQSPQNMSVPSPPQNTQFKNLEDMKVSDLKAELKKRNLRVSGAKSHLIQRLKPYAECNPNSRHRSISFFIPLNDDSNPDSNVASPLSQTGLSSPGSPQHSVDTPSGINRITDSPNHNNNNNGNIAMDQQRKIEELQRELLNSQLLLQQQLMMKQKMKQFSQQQAQLQNNRSLSVPSIVLKTEDGEQHQVAETGDKAMVVKSINNNDIYIPKQSFDGIPAVCRQRSNTVISLEQPTPVIIDQLHNVDGQKQRTTSLPNFMGTFMPNGFLCNMQNNESQITSQPSLPHVQNNNTLHSEDIDMISSVADAESVPQNKNIPELFTKKEPTENMTDVLDLLIKDREFDLPESVQYQPPQSEFHPSNATIVGDENDEENSLNIPSQHLSLEDLGIFGLDNFPLPMDAIPEDDDNCSSNPHPYPAAGFTRDHFLPFDPDGGEMMNVDTDQWLDRLIRSTPDQGLQHWTNGPVDPLNSDFNLNENDYKISAECIWE